MNMSSDVERKWINSLIKQDEIDRYLNNGRDFVDEQLIWSQLEKQKNPSDSYIREIIAKSLELEDSILDLEGLAHLWSTSRRKFV